MNTKQIKVFIALFALATILVSYNNTSHTTEFQTWKTQFGVKFTLEFQNTYREKIFLENLAKINAHNANPDRSYDMGLNQFSALAHREFLQTYLGTIVVETITPIIGETIQNTGEIDWTTKGAVTPIKNQGSCGSCWAFSTTGALEGLSKLAYGSLQSFSQQQLVDCSGAYGNQACNGGLMNNAFKFVKANGIVTVTEAEYPYIAVKQVICSKPTGQFKISGYIKIRTCNGLVSALTGRPVSVAVDASNWSTYKSGVFDNCDASLNHGVLLVGVSADSNWKVKNSWGATWGESGFIRLAKGNTCGICNMASYPSK